MFCCTLLYVHFSIAIILMGKRELIALLNLSSWCLVMVERLFLAVPWGCLQFVIVVFPDHTHLLFFLPKPSSLYKISCAALNGDLCAIHASSEYSGESAHLRRQTLDNVINIKISCAGSKGSWEYARLHRLA